MQLSQRLSPLQRGARHHQLVVGAEQTVRPGRGKAGRGQGRGDDREVQRQRQIRFVWFHLDQGIAGTKCGAQCEYNGDYNTVSYKRLWKMISKKQNHRKITDLLTEPTQRRHMTHHKNDKMSPVNSLPRPFVERISKYKSIHQPKPPAPRS